MSKLTNSWSIEKWLSLRPLHLQMIVLGLRPMLVALFWDGQFHASTWYIHDHGKDQIYLVSFESGCTKISNSLPASSIQIYYNWRYPWPGLVSGFLVVDVATYGMKRPTTRRGILIGTIPFFFFELTLVEATFTFHCFTPWWIFLFVVTAGHSINQDPKNSIVLSIHFKVVTKRIIIWRPICIQV